LKLNKIKILAPQKVTLKVNQSVNIEKKVAGLSTWDNLEADGNALDLDDEEPDKALQDEIKEAAIQKAKREDEIAKAKLKRDQDLAQAKQEMED